MSDSANFPAAGREILLHVTSNELTKAKYGFICSPAACRGNETLFKQTLIIQQLSLKNIDAQICRHSIFHLIHKDGTFIVNSYE